jgi:hypothetical protein
MIYVTGEKNKPRALQAALPFTTKSVVGIIDAESIAAPGLLINIDTVFQSTQADIVQGGVQLMNYGDSWWALLNCIEYYRWFKSRLHWHALQRFITLGGNTVFMRRSAIEAVGGWDVLNLTEDAEIGVRLSVAGFKVAVVYDPKFATRESTPDTVRQVHRHPARQATRQRGDDDLVDFLAAGELADRVDGVGVDDLAVGLRAGLLEPGQLLLQAPLRQGPGDLVGARDHAAVQPAAGPAVGALGLGHRGHEVEAARSGVHAFGELGRELFAAEGLVGHDEVPTHDLTPLGLVCLPRL